MSAQNTAGAGFILGFIENISFTESARNRASYRRPL